MKIDWKSIAQSISYKKLKASIVFLHTRQGYTKKEAYEVMSKAVGLAKSLSVKKSITFQEALNELEEQRSYNVCNYYTHVANREKPSTKKHASTLKGLIRYYKRDRHSRYIKKSAAKSAIRDFSYRAKQKRKELGKKLRYRSL